MVAFTSTGTELTNPNVINLKKELEQNYLAPLRKPFHLSYHPFSSDTMSKKNGSHLFSSKSQSEPTCPIFQ